MSSQKISRRTAHTRPVKSGRTRPIEEILSHVERVVSMSSEHSGREDVTFWKSRSPAERLYGLENLRRQLYGYTTAPRLQRVLEIAQQE